MFSNNHPSLIYADLALTPDGCPYHCISVHSGYCRGYRLTLYFDHSWLFKWIIKFNIRTYCLEDTANYMPIIYKAQMLSFLLNGLSFEYKRSAVLVAGWRAMPRRCCATQSHSSEPGASHQYSVNVHQTHTTNHPRQHKLANLQTYLHILQIIMSWKIVHGCIVFGFLYGTISSDLVHKQTNL